MANLTIVPIYVAYRHSFRNKQNSYLRTTYTVSGCVTRVCFFFSAIQNSRIDVYIQYRGIIRPGRSHGLWLEEVKCLVSAQTKTTSRNVHEHNMVLLNDHTLRDMRLLRMYSNTLLKSFVAVCEEHHPEIAKQNSR